MKRFIIWIFFLVSFYTLNAQNVGIGIHTGSEKRRYIEHEVELNRLDTSYRIRLVPGSMPKGFLSLNFYKKNGTGWDFLLGYNRNMAQIIDPSPRDSIFNPFMNPIGNFRVDVYDLHVDRYFLIAKPNDRLNLSWGYGLNFFFNQAESQNITSPELFNVQNIFAGVTPKFLGKLSYATTNKRILFVGSVVYNLVDFSWVQSRRLNPNLTIPQQTNSIFDLDFPNNINGRIGIVFILNKKKNTE